MHIKLKGMEQPCNNIFCPSTPSNLWVGLKSKENSECGHIAYQREKMYRLS